MVLSAKVSTKNQISIPSEARRRLGIEPGDRLTVAVRGDELILRRRPEKASDRLRGLAAGKGWYEPDPVTYVRRLRDEWEEQALEREARIDPGPGGAARARLDRQQPADLPHGERPETG